MQQSYSSVCRGGTFLLTDHVVGLDTAGGNGERACAIQLGPGDVVKVVDYPCRYDDRMAEVVYANRSLMVPARDLEHRSRKMRFTD